MGCHGLLLWNSSHEPALAVSYVTSLSLGWCTAFHIQRRAGMELMFRSCPCLYFLMHTSSMWKVGAVAFSACWKEITFLQIAVFWKGEKVLDLWFICCSLLPCDRDRICPVAQKSASGESCFSFGDIFKTRFRAWIRCFLDTYWQMPHFW